MVIEKLQNTVECLSPYISMLSFDVMRVIIWFYGSVQVFLFASSTRFYIQIFFSGSKLTIFISKKLFWVYSY